MKETFENFRRKVALVLAIVMIISCLPMNALAAISQEVYNGAQWFSIAQDKDIYVTFEFMNGDTLVDKQIVNQTKSESVTEPGTPDVPEGKKFEGWYIGETKFAPGTVSGYEETTTVTVAAKFSDIYYVYFMSTEFENADGSKSRSVVQTLEARSDNDYKVTPLSETDYMPKDAVVTKWIDRDKNTEFTAETVVTKDTYLNPVTTPCYWVSFDTLGGDGVDSKYVKEGDTLELSTVKVPERYGYKFKGWSAVKYGSTAITSVTPTESIELYAIWEGEATSYTVVYWGENADDNDYSVLAVRSYNTTAGTQVASGISTALPSYDSDKDSESYQTERGYFDIDNAVVSPASAVAAADGSTVINIKYPRKLVTIEFPDIDSPTGESIEVLTCTKTRDLNCTNPWHFLGHNDSCYVAHVHTKPACYTTYSSYVITKKIGADISYIWETGDIKTELDKGNMFKSSVTGKYYAYLEKMPDRDVTMTLYTPQGSNTFTWHYCLETLDGTVPEGKTGKEDKNVQYYIEHTTQAKGRSLSLTYEEDYFPITGFTQRDSTVPSFTDRVAYLYYTRNEQYLRFKNYDKYEGDSDYYKEYYISYETPLTEYGGTPDRPDGFTEKAVFKGWYLVEPDAVTDETVPYTSAENGHKLTGTMPAKDLLLHAYWEEPRIEVGITITIDGVTTNYDPVMVKRGTTIAESSLYQQVMLDIAGEELLYWVNTDNNKIVHVDQKLYDSVSIKAVFADDYYTVTYDANGGTGTLPTDSNKYGPQTKAKAAEGKALTKVVNGQNYQFAYWTASVINDEGATVEQIYYPGQYVPIAFNNVTLKANYVPTYEKVNVTYAVNKAGVDGVTVKDSYTDTTALDYNNSQFTVLSYTDTGMTVPTGYKFVGWTDVEGSEEVKFEEKQTVRVNNVGSNTLYAIFELDVFPYTVKFYKDSYSELNYISGADVTCPAVLFETPLAELEYSTEIANDKVPAGYGNKGTMDPDNSLKKITSNASANVIVVVLPQLDATLNYVPVTFKHDGTKDTASVGGSVSTTSNTVKAATGEPDGSTATPLAGYKFVGWYDNANCTGDPLSKDAAFAPTKAADALWTNATYYAKFEELPDVTIKYEAKTGGSVVPPSESIAPATGTAAGSEAAAAAGYKFKNWTNANGGVVSTESAYTPTKKDTDPNATVWVNGTTYYANFEIDDKQNVVVTYTAEVGGTINGTATDTIQIVTGETLTEHTAVPGYGYEFDGWYEDDARIETAEKTLTTATAKENLNKKGSLFAATTFVAKFKRTYGDLTISKKLTDESNAPKAKEFTFTVEATKAVEGVDLDAELEAWAESDKNKVGATYASGKLTVKITVDPGKTATVTLDDLPVGEYTVEEQENAAYTTTPSERKYTRVAVTKDGDVTKAFTNTRKLYGDDGSVTVNKSWLKSDVTTTLTTGLEDITIQLKADGTVKDSKELTVNKAGEHNWSATFAGYPSHTTAGVEITYTADEAEELAGFTKTLDGLTVKNIANTNTPYTVEYYFENIDKSEYTIDAAETVNETAETGSTVTAPEKTFTGFTYDADNEYNVQSGIVTGDGKLVLKRYYDRDTANVTISKTLSDEEFANTDATFTFKITEVSELTPAEGESENMNLTDEFAEWTKTNSDKVSISLKHGETDTASFNGLPTGNYKVEEISSNAAAYNVTPNKAQEVALTANAEVKFTNTRKLYGGDGNVTVEKVWMDSDGTTPLAASLMKSVTMNLLADSVEVGKQVITTENKTADEHIWQFTFEKMPEYTADGEKKIKYTASEDAVEGFTADANADDLSVTNTRKLHTLTITYTGPEDGVFVAPTTYTATLGYGASYDVTSPMVPGYTPNEDRVSGAMPDADVTVEVEYSEVTDMVTISYTVVTIGADGKEDKTNVGGKLTRYSDANIAPATGTVAANTANANNGYVFEGWTLKQDEGFKKTHNELTPAKADDNDSAVWTNREYVATFKYTGWAKEENQITFGKEWLSTADSKNDVRATVTLYRQIGDDESRRESVDSFTTEKDDNKTQTKNNLAEYAPNSVAYKYFVEEGNVNGYTPSSNNGAEVKFGDTLIIKNTANEINETISISGTKIWEDPESTSHPTITINLKQDTAAYKTATIADGDSEYSFTNLPKYDPEDGHTYVYTVTESVVPGYTTTPAEGYTGISATVMGKDFTNTIVYDEYPEVKYTKSFDFDGKDFGGYPNITINVYADKQVDGEGNVTSAGQLVYSYTHEGSTISANTFETVIGALPKYAVKDGEKVITWPNGTNYTGNYDGHAFVYSIEEDAIAGYADPVYGGNAESGFTVLNTYTGAGSDVVTINVLKQWKDGDGETLDSDLQPDSLAVTLERDDVTKTYAATLYKTEGWAKTFPVDTTYTLLSYATTGEEITYTLEETIDSEVYTETTAANANVWTVGTEDKILTLTNEKKGEGNPEVSKTAQIDNPIAVTVNGTSKTMVKNGETITYTIVAENPTNVKKNMTVTDKLQSGLVYQSSTVDGVSAVKDEVANGQNLTWDLGEVAPFTSKTIVVVAKVEVDLNSITDNVIKNTAELMVDNSKVDSSEETETEIFNPNFTVEKKISEEDKTAIQAGTLDTVNFTITVTNTGNVDLDSVVLKELKGALMVDVVALKNAETKQDKTSELTGDHAGEMKAAGYTISNLKVNASESTVVSYAMAKKDISVENTVTATAAHVAGDYEVTKDASDNVARDTGSLTITKTLTLNEKAEAELIFSDLESKANTANTFAVEVKSGSEVVATLAKGDFTDASKTITVPLGSYTVTETDGYDSVKGYDHDGSATSVTANVTEQGGSAKLVNNYKRSTVAGSSITLTKTWNDFDDVNKLRPAVDKFYMTLEPAGNEVNGDGQEYQTGAWKENGNVWTANIVGDVYTHDLYGNELTYQIGEFVVSEFVEGEEAEALPTAYSRSGDATITPNTTKTAEIINSLTEATLKVKKTATDETSDNQLDNLVFVIEIVNKEGDVVETLEVPANNTVTSKQKYAVGASYKTNEVGVKLNDKDLGNKALEAWNVTNAPLTELKAGETTLEVTNVRVKTSTDDDEAGTVTVTKEWKAPADATDEEKAAFDAATKPVIYLQLAKGDNKTPIDGYRVELEAKTDKEREYVFGETDELALPACELDGTLITYSVLEVDADGNDWEPNGYDKSENGLKVTNTYDGEGKTDEDEESLISVSVTKYWVDGAGVVLTDDVIAQIPEAQRPSALKVELASDGVGVTIDEAEASLNGSAWTNTWESLPAYDMEGTAVEYTVSETLTDEQAKYYVQKTEAKLDGVYEAKAEVTFTEGTADYALTLVNEKLDLDPTDDDVKPEKTPNLEGAAVYTQGETTQVKMGETFTYSIKYQNHKNTAQTITLTDTMENGLDFKSAEAAKGSYQVTYGEPKKATTTVEGKTTETETIVMTIENVPAFAEGEVIVTVTVDKTEIDAAMQPKDSDTTMNPQLKNSVTLSIGGSVVSSDDAEDVEVHYPTIKVYKTGAIDQASGLATFEIHAKNTGNVDLKDVYFEEVEFEVEGVDKLDELESDLVTVDFTEKLTLAIGEETAKYTVTYDALAPNEISASNTVKVYGTPNEGDEQVEDDDTASVSRQKGELSVTKTVAGLESAFRQGNAIESLPDDFEVQIYRADNKELVKTILRSEFEANGTATVTIPAGTYYVEETGADLTAYGYELTAAAHTKVESVTVPSNGEASATLQNVYQRIKIGDDEGETGVVITKIWADNSDQSHVRPSDFVVTLTGDDNPATTYSTAGIEWTKSEDGNTWTATISPLYSHTAAGDEITYTVSETGTNLDKYYTPNFEPTTINLAGNGKKGEKVEITNTLNQRALTITKTVNDATGEGDALYFGFQLTAKDNNQIVKKAAGDANTWIEGDSILLIKAGESATVATLADGQTYTIEEVGVYKAEDDDYVSLKTGVEDPRTAWTATFNRSAESDFAADITLGEGSEKMEVVNTRIPAYDNGVLTVEKVWKNDENDDWSTRSDVTINLAADQEVKLEKTSDVIAVDDDSVTFAKLPLYALNGKPISYTITEEVKDSGYEYESDGGKWSETETNTFIFTNTLKRIDVKVEKEWKSNGITFTKPKLTMNLMYGEKLIKSEIGEDGEFTFKSVPYRESGYTVVEDDAFLTDKETQFSITYEGENGEEVTSKNASEFVFIEVGSVEIDAPTDGVAAAKRKIVNTLKIDSDGDGKIDNGDDEAAAIIIEKTIDLNGTQWNADEAQIFNFTVTWTDSNGDVHTKKAKLQPDDSETLTDVTDQILVSAGEEITVTETETQGWTADALEIEKTSSKDEQVRFEFKNTRKLITDDNPEAKKVTKNWSDLADDVLPAKTYVQMYRTTADELDPTEDEKVGSPIEMTGDAEAWTHYGLEANLPFADENDNPYTYYFREVKLDSEGEVEKAYEVDETITLDVVENGEPYSVSYKVIYPDNNTVTNTRTEGSNPDKTAEFEDEKVTKGDKVTYTIKRQNHHEIDATVVITDVLAKGLSYNEDAKYIIADSESAKPANEITGVSIVDSDGKTTIVWTPEESLEPDQWIIIQYTVDVTERAYVVNDLTNEVNVNLNNEPSDEFTADSVTIPTENFPQLTLDKQVTSKPANESAYAFGETISYSVTVTNTGNVKIDGIKVIDTIEGYGYEPVQLNAEEFELAKGDSWTYEYEHVVTEQDIIAGQVKNVVTAEAPNPDKPEEMTPVVDDEATVPTNGLKGSVTITKVIVDETDDKGDVNDLTFVVKLVRKNGPTDAELSEELGEEIDTSVTFEFKLNSEMTENEVTVTPVTLGGFGIGLEYEIEEIGVMKADETKADAKRLEAWNIEYLDTDAGNEAVADDGIITITAGTNAVTVTNSRKELGEDPEKPKDTDGTLTVTKLWRDSTGEIDLVKTENKVVPESIDVQLKRSCVKQGEVQVKHGEVKQLSDPAWTDTFTKLALTDLDGNPYTYEVEEVGIDKDGKVTYRIDDVDYTFEVTPTNDQEYNKYTITNKLTDNKAENPEKLVEEEKREGDENDGVEIGDIVTYTIKRTSHLATDATATITDTLPAEVNFIEDSMVVRVDRNSYTRTDAEEPDEGEYTFDVDSMTWTFDVPAMADIEIEFQAQVNELAVDSETAITNKATVSLGKNEPQDSFEPNAPLTVLKPSLTIEKTATEFVKPNGEIVYTITVTNNGEGRAVGVVVEDDLSELTQLVSDAVTVDKTAEVDAEDLKGMKVTWNVNGAYESIDGTTGILEAGESAKLEVKVNVKSKTDLDALVEGESLADTVKPLSEKSKIVNAATITAPETNIEVAEAEAETRIVRIDVEKTSEIERTPESDDNRDAETDPEGKLTASLGDKIIYTITVYNTGAVDLENITVSDLMLDVAKQEAEESGKTVEEVIEIDETIMTLELSEDEVEVAIDEVPAGEFRTFTYAITVKEHHILDGSLTNVADVNAENPNGTDPDSGTGSDTVTFDPPTGEMKVTKEVVSTKETYKIGEKVEYLITIENTGNVTLTDIKVDDTLYSDLYKDEPLYELLTPEKTSIAPGETTTATYTYEVQSGDVLPTYEEDGSIRKHMINNVATAVATPVAGEPNPVTASDNAEAEAKHTVLIRFICSLEGTILKYVEVPYGGSTTPPEFPRHYGYNIVGWSGGIWENVFSNQNIFAMFEKRPGWYTDYNEDLTILDADIPLAGGYISNVGDCFD